MAIPPSAGQVLWQLFPWRLGGQHMDDAEPPSSVPTSSAPGPANDRIKRNTACTNCRDAKVSLLLCYDGSSISRRVVAGYLVWHLLTPLS